MLCSSSVKFRFTPSPLALGLLTSFLLASCGIPGAPKASLEELRAFYGNTQTDLLSAAVENEDVNHIKKIFQYSPSDRILYKNLLKAIKLDNLEIFRLILNENHKLLDMGELGTGAARAQVTYPVHNIAWHGKVDMFKEIIKINLNELNKSNSLLSPDLGNYADKVGAYPIHFAVMGYTGNVTAPVNAKVEIIRQILKKDPQQVNTKTLNGDYPIHVAAKYGRFGARSYIREILEVDSQQLNIRNRKGFTPLSLANEHYNIKLVNYLCTLDSEPPQICQSSRK